MKKIILLLSLGLLITGCMKDDVIEVIDPVVEIPEVLKIQESKGLKLESTITFTIFGSSIYDWYLISSIKDAKSMVLFLSLVKTSIRFFKLFFNLGFRILSNNILI